MSENALESFWDRESTRHSLTRWIRAGLEEDRAADDVTTRGLFPDPTVPAVARITAGEPGVICGGIAAAEVFRGLDVGVELGHRTPDGVPVQPGERVLEVTGALGPLLAAERTALNILGHLSGIATRTSRWSGIAGGVSILDTRKTIPGLRDFQRHAVRAGGGTNHRHDLAEMPLVKENHRDLLRGILGLTGPGEDIPEIVRRLRQHAPGLPIEIEVEDEASFRACLECGVDLVLLDNRSPETIRQWIDAAKGDGLTLPPLEASGGITAETLPDYAGSGVSRISIGALTHSVTALDLSLHVELRNPEER